jgi:hypothetical protein
MDFVFNNDLRGKSIDSLEYIFIGDNPGKTEKNKGLYLVNEPAKPNNSGTIAKGIFDVICPSGNYIVLNKTPIHTDKTSNLQKYKDDKILGTSLRYMAKLLYKIHCLKLDAKVFIFGFGDGCFHPKSYDKNGNLSAFFEQLKILYKEKPWNAVPRIMKHFSYYNFFESFSYYTEETKGVSLCKNLTLDDMKKVGFPLPQLLHCIDELPYRYYLFGKKKVNYVVCPK